jgi:hypothetical protein
MRLHKNYHLPFSYLALILALALLPVACDTGMDAIDDEESASISGRTTQDVVPDPCSHHGIQVLVEVIGIQSQELLTRHGHPSATVWRRRR